MVSASANFVIGQGQNERRNQRGGNYNGSGSYGGRGRSCGKGRWNNNNRPVCQVSEKTGAYCGQLLSSVIQEFSRQL